MCPQDGQQSCCALPASRQEPGSPVSTGRAPRMPNWLRYVSAPTRYLASWSALNAGSRQPRHAVRRHASRGGRSWLHLACVSVLCLTMLPSCSMLLPKPQTAQPVAVKPEKLRCLDRALEQCPGVDAMRPTSCADAVVMAVDGMTALASCQDLHAELVRCVTEYQERNR